MNFFVVGTSRSGSTLLRNILNAHPNVAVLNESHWLPRMHETHGTGEVATADLIDVMNKTFWDSGQPVVEANLERSSTTRSELDARLRSRLGSTTSVVEFHREVVDALFNLDGRADVRGDKTPDYGFYMSLLQQMWPEAKFIHVLRNGIDTSASMAQHSGCKLMVAAGYDCWCPLSYNREHERHRSRRRPPRAAFVGSWRRRVETIRSQADLLATGTYLEVRYERLLADPCSTLLDVVKFLSIEPDESWLSTSVRQPRTAPLQPRDDKLFAELSFADLRALAEVGDVEYLDAVVHLRSNSSDEALSHGKRALATGDPQLAVNIGLGVLAMRDLDSEMVNDACEVVRDGLAKTRSKRFSRAWAARAAAELGQ